MMMYGSKRQMQVDVKDDEKIVFCVRMKKLEDADAMLYFIESRNLNDQQRPKCAEYFRSFWLS